ncbi:AbrB/MazE/SpoVT family DNA-binding domain-containing protein [Pseudoroseomonas wenyumeiae]|nr:AbrB/MazE/SpoVT family DNA-binding domain-containing protein [Pseudoroseomonas wenyumeiae]
MAKLTSKNQLTLPKAVVEALGSPRHFRIQVHDGVLLLWPGRLVCAADAPHPAAEVQDSRARQDGKG